MYKPARASSVVANVIAARLDKVRDLFIIGCYSGLRFSDLSQLRPENINELGNMVKVRTQKTDEVVIIPLNRYIKKILNKYGGNPPAAYTNQKMNEYLKELGQLAGIDEDIIVTATKGVKDNLKLSRDGN